MASRLGSANVALVLIALVGAPPAPSQVTAYGEIGPDSWGDCPAVLSCYWPFPLVRVEMSEAPPPELMGTWVRVQGQVEAPSGCSPESGGRMSNVRYAEGGPIDFGVGRLILDHYTGECHEWESPELGRVILRAAELPDSVAEGDLYRVIGTAGSYIQYLCIPRHVIRATEVRREPVPTLEESWGGIKYRYRLGTTG